MRKRNWNHCTNNETLAFIGPPFFRFCRMGTTLVTGGGSQSLSRIVIPTMCLQIQFFEKDGQLHIEQLTPLPSFTQMMGNLIFQRINFFEKRIICRQLKLTTISAYSGRAG